MFTWDTELCIKLSRNSYFMLDPFNVRHGRSVIGRCFDHDDCGIVLQGAYGLNSVADSCACM